MSQSHAAKVAGTHGTWTLEDAYTFLVEQCRELRIADDARFHFKWRNRQFDVRTGTQATRTIVDVRACLGQMPFSAENRSLRTALVERFRAEPPALRDAIGTDPRQRIWLIRLTELPKQPAINDLLCVATAVVMAYDKLLVDVLPHLRQAA